MSDYDSVGGGASGAASGAMSGAMAGASFGPIGMGIGAVIGGLFGSKKTKVPKPPTYSQLMNNNLDAQSGIQGKLLSLEGEYRPQYQGLQEQTLNRQLYGGDGTEGYISMLNKANTALQGVQAQAGAGYMNTLGGLTGQARGLLQSQGQAQMHNTLMAEAQSELGLGTSLNTQDQRQAFQTANQAMAMRGMSGRQGVAAGVLSNYGMGLNRQAQRRQFASSMMSQDSALQSAALQMAGGAMGQYGAGGQFMGQANTMLGQYQPQIFQPESQMGTQAQGMKYQHGMGIAKAGMQQQQQLLSTLGSFGSFAAGGGFNNIMGGGTPAVANPNQYSQPIGPSMPSSPYSFNSGSFSMIDNGYPRR